MTRKIVVLAEKGDQAKKLAEAMGWSDQRGSWVGTFEGNPVTLVAARGHLVRLQNPDEVIPGLPWNDPSALLNIPRQIPLTVGDDIPNSPEAAQPRVYLERIRRVLADADELIIATDSDREGEAIGWSIKKFLGFNGKVRRAWFSAGLDKKSLVEAMSNLKEPHETKGYYRASQARGHSDWAYMFLVRAYTHFASYSCFGPNLGRGEGASSVLSVGRVQTPTVGLIVKREEAIENFVKKDHFEISGEFRPNGDVNTVVARYSPEYTQETIDKAVAGVEWNPHTGVVEDDKPVPLDKPLFVGKEQIEAFRSRLKANSDKAYISEYDEGSRSEHPPATFDLPHAQKALSDALGVSSGLAQTILEDLYEQGWTSYARTSKSALPMNLYEPSERNGMLASVFALDEVSEQAKFVASIHNGKSNEYTPFVPKIFTKEGMEHYGIVPTTQVMTKASFAALSPKKTEGGKVLHTAQNMRDAYMIVVKQFIQVLYPPVKYSTQKLTFCVPVEDLLQNKESPFKIKAERISDPGWRAAFGKGATKDTSISAQKKGGLATFMDLHLAAASTSPPKRYTDPTLSLAMANISKEVTDPKYRALLKNSEGIGTPATRKTIIKTIIDRGYVVLKNDYFVPTDKGRDLIKSVPKGLSDPVTTAMWEDVLVKICKEKDDNEAKKMRNDFVEKQLDRVERLIKLLIDTYSNNLGEKIARKDGRISTKMINVIKLIAAKKGITLDPKILKDFDLASAFLNENVSRDDTPSGAQLDFLDRIVANLPDKVKYDPSIRGSKRAVSEFIDKNSKYMPPNPGQLKYAQDLRAKLPEGAEFDENVFKYAGLCSKFIDQHKPKSANGSSKSGSGKSTGKSGEKSAGKTSYSGKGQYQNRQTKS